MIGRTRRMKETARMMTKTRKMRNPVLLVLKCFTNLIETFTDK